MLKANPWPVVSFAAALGFQVSGYTNVPLAIALWTLCVLVALHAYPPRWIWDQIRRRAKPPRRDPSTPELPEERERRWQGEEARRKRLRVYEASARRRGHELKYKIVDPDGGFSWRTRPSIDELTPPQRDKFFQIHSDVKPWWLWKHEPVADIVDLWATVGFTPNGEPVLETKKHAESVARLEHGLYQLFWDPGFHDINYQPTIQGDEHCLVMEQQGQRARDSLVFSVHIDDEYRRAALREGIADVIARVTISAKGPRES